MKKTSLILLYFSLFAAIQSCQKKKLTEVVEVPLPKAEEKITIGNPDDIKAETGTFQLTKLPYAYDALIPEIDALTMELHYSKHYLANANGLNRAVTGTQLEQLPIEDVLAKLDLNDVNLRNNAGGFFNHTIYFESMTPKGDPTPKDSLVSTINADFGSFEIFEKEFKDEANKQIGSGWTWLVLDKSGKLQITSTVNHDNPLMSNAIIKGKPLLGIDLWEHAYYLNYQYKKKNYVDAFFKKINWKKVGERYEAAIKK
jgi:Fe-Mn family superoxide dismutase